MELSVWDLQIRSGFWLSGNALGLEFGFRVSRNLPVPHLYISAARGSRFRVSGSGFRVSGFRLRVSGFRREESTDAPLRRRSRPASSSDFKWDSPSDGV